MITIVITNPGTLIDREVGVEGIGGIASLFTDTEGAVENAAADKIRDQLAAQGVDAIVNVAPTTPLARVRSNVLPFLVGAVAGAVVTVLVQGDKKK